MAKITFKCRPVAEIMPDNTDTGVFIIYLPKFERKHCDMHAFRAHKKYGAYANSDLFRSILARISRDIAPFGHIRTDNVPDNVTIDNSGFLWKVEIDV